MQIILEWSVCLCMFKERYTHTSGFPAGSYSKESAYNAGDLGLIPGWGRSPREGNGNLLQCSCLGNPMDKAWQATVHGVTKSRATNLDLAANTHTQSFWLRVPLFVLQLKNWSLIY